MRIIFIILLTTICPTFSRGEVHFKSDTLLFHCSFELLNQIVDSNLICVTRYIGCQTYADRNIYNNIRNANKKVDNSGVITVTEETIAMYKPACWKNIVTFHSIVTCLKGKVSGKTVSIVTPSYEPGKRIYFSMENVVFLEKCKLSDEEKDNYDIEDRDYYSLIDETHGCIKLKNDKLKDYWKKIKLIIIYIYSSNDDKFVKLTDFSQFSTIREAADLLLNIDKSPKHRELYQKLYRESKNPRLKARIKKRVKVEE